MKKILMMLLIVIMLGGTIHMASSFDMCHAGEGSAPMDEDVDVP
jgi:hypothetical protein